MAFRDMSHNMIGPIRPILHQVSLSPQQLRPDAFDSTAGFSKWTNLTYSPEKKNKVRQFKIAKSRHI